ncbi:Sad1/UNC-like carboxy-terminal protein (macronuclear) [Tetrahymena thermophila SB210]|uniref:Sad1/UNC-like carboxy-terminal protein n=1 Tax=Tetrahymena thermophila (strain SB210) TaxID=312017 RepID=I7MLU6_TETTS|nr:Sad1/UNC-like carboxy-terminal protein [Tetrahymena thermophila SB210]EAS03093.2 Sad1/UNC-like carboxy-terminal protein [Tetrahymena thermophila SB210]|eukprot:XP_001023338.2 Sad1/UNC-like carboxy-terminal protein [Tetrahymena thermophila SB210]
MDFFRLFLIIVLSVSLVKYQFQSAQNFIDSLENIYTSFLDDKYSGFYQGFKEQIYENEFSRSLQIFIKNFDLKYFLNKILMARIEQSKIKSEINKKNNFASLYGGASIIEKNEGSLNTKSILDDNIDKYMLNKCSMKNKYIVVSLKEDININGFAIINKEFYSSNVKDIVVYGSNEYPIEMQEWVQLGEFRLENIYEWQQFPLKTMWARYVRFEFKTHYDDEYYCTITQIKVFGSPILADFKKDFVNQKRDKKTVNSNKLPTGQSYNDLNKTTEVKNIQLKEHKYSNQNQISVPGYERFEKKNQQSDIGEIIINMIQTRQQCKNLNWEVFKEQNQCSEEEQRQQQLEFEQSQSIFTILTMNISEIRRFIDEQVQSNEFFNNEISSYKSQLLKCNQENIKVDQLNKYQMDQIEDLRKMFYTVTIVGSISFLGLLLLICSRKKQTIDYDNAHQFSRR